jgi:hypothetical protein
MAHIVVNGKKITNPIAILIVGLSSVILTGLITALVIFLILPLAGVVLSLSVGLTIVIFIAILVGLPILILGRIIFGILIRPFTKEKDER